MRRRTELRCMGSGVLHSFVSRNNDLGGYWALGKLYSYARQVGTTVLTLDLINWTIDPPVSNLARVFPAPEVGVLCERYWLKLAAMMKRRAVPPAWLARAAMTIEFESTSGAPRYPRKGAAFLCQLTLTDDLGGEHTLRADGWCWPHNLWEESCSARG